MGLNANEEKAHEDAQLERLVVAFEGIGSALNRLADASERQATSTEASVTAATHALEVQERLATEMKDDLKRL